MLQVRRGSYILIKLLKAEELGFILQAWCVVWHNCFSEWLSLFHTDFCLDFYKCSSLSASCKQSGWAACQSLGTWTGCIFLLCWTKSHVDKLLQKSNVVSVLLRCSRAWKKCNTNKFKRDGKVPHIITEEGICASSWFTARSFLLVDHLQEHPETIKRNGSRNMICKSTCW